MRATDRLILLALRCAAVLVSLHLSGVAARAQQPSALPTGKVLIADVRIQGNVLIPAQQIMAQLKTRPGGEYLPEVVQEDVRNLYATKLYGNIQPVVKPEPDGRVIVYFFFRDYPSVVEEVVYQGAKHLSQDDLDKLTNIRKGTPLNPTANKLGCQAIVRKLNDAGRPFANCDLLSGDKPGDTKVIFNITEGPVVKIRGVGFVGNTWASGGRLATLINSKKILGIFPGTYNPQMVEADIGKLEEYYKTFGFLDVQVSRELQLTEDGRDVYLIFHVLEGTRYTIQSPPHVVNNKNIPLEQLEQLSKIKAGQFYSETDVQRDVTNIKDYYGLTGRDTKVQAIPVFNRDMPGVVTVNYEVEERPPARVGQIFIVGNERTKQNVILRQVPLYPGQVLTYPDLRIAERNLQKLGIFESSQDGNVKPTVTVIDPESPSPYKDILVNVQEANTGSLMFGVGVNSNAGLTGSIVLNERNFDILKPPLSFDELFSGSAWRGAGQEFRVEAVPGTQVSRYTVSWREPFFLDTPNSLGVSGYYYERQYNEDNEERTGGRINVGRRLTQEWTITAGLRLENIEISAVEPWAPPDYLDVVGGNFLTGLRAEATYETRDSSLRGTSGTKVDFSYEQCFWDGPNNGGNTFPLVNVSADQYFTLWQRADGSGRQVLALHSQAGWAGSDTPVFERFFAGGFNSLRGFQFRGVGPDVIGYKVGGDFMFLNSVEYQVPVKASDSIFLVAFVDSGTVESTVEIKDYRVSAGVGVRFVIPMMGPVPIALDFGFPIVKGPADNTQVFSFWMGFSR